MTSNLHAAAIAAVFASAFAGLAAVEPALAAGDAFAEACASRAKATAAHCACESKLARRSLSAREQSAMILAMTGDTNGFRAAVAAMGAEPTQAFVGKMKQLQARTEAECR